MSILKPVYLLAGRWGKNPDPVITMAIQECGKSNPSIAYIGAAAGDSLEFFRHMTAYFQDAGAGDTIIAPTVNSGVDIKRTKHLLESADMVFVSGGDVEAGMNVLRERKLIGFLHNLYQSGKSFFAVSAGSLMLAKEWIRWQDSNDDNTAEIFPCLNIAPLICDAHGEADDWEELIALLQIEKPGAIGYGIVSGSAIRMLPDGQIVAIGGVVNRFIRRNDKVEKIPDLVPVI